MEMKRNLFFARQFSMDLQQLLHESLMVRGLQLGAIDLKKSQVSKQIDLVLYGEGHQT